MKNILVEKKYEKMFYEGVELCGQEKFLEAEIIFEFIRKEYPRRTSVLNNLTITKIKLGKIKEAEKISKEILSQDLNNVDAKINLAICMGEQFFYKECLTLIDEIISNNQNLTAEIFIYKGLILKRIGKYIDSLDTFNLAIKKDQDNSIAKWNLSLLHLLLSNLQEGWKYYHYRFLKDRRLNKQFENVEELMSVGCFLNNKKIIIWCEQGFGDIILFSRYLLLLKKYNCKIYIKVNNSIKNLIETLDPEILVNKSDKYDFQCSVMDLPKIFNTTFATIPDNTPYFFIPRSIIELSQKSINSQKKNIGLAWSSGKKTAYGNLRSIPLINLEKIYSMKDKYEFYCLQKDIDQNDIKIMQDCNIHNLGDRDFLNIAGIIKNLDLVISVDTSILHLSGSLGVKTFALIPFSPDWRWFLNIDYSPWYKSLKIFRSDFQDNWNKQIALIKNFLEKY